MRKNYFLLIAIVLFVATSCQEVIDIEKEKEAIINVIEGEAKAFIERDYDRVASMYVQDETNIRMGASKMGYGYRVRWEEIGSAFKKYIENNPEPDTRKPQLKENMP